MQLNTKRLLLRKFTEADADYYYQLVFNDEVMKYTTGKALTNKEAFSRFQKGITINKQNQDLGMFCVFRNEDNVFIGTAKLTETEVGEAELGYSFLPEYWRQKYGTEVTNRLVEYARTLPRLNRLMAIIDDENIASKKILLNLGFSFSEEKIFDGLLGYVYRLKL